MVSAYQPLEPHDIRLRMHLHNPLPHPEWPAGHAMRPFRPEDALDLHGLLAEVFDDGADGPFETWWPQTCSNPDFDPDLWFLVHAGDGALLAAALCWKRGFVKDLAVRTDARRRGIARELLLHAFGVFRERGSAYVDLKTNLVSNADAVRLYERIGMVPVAWEG